MYEYTAKVLEVTDGDTIKVQVINQFFDIEVKAEPDIRLAGINAPEMKGESRPRGEASKRFLKEDLALEGKEVLIKVIKKEKYGRWLADVYYDGTHLNALMVEKGLAVPFMVEKPKEDKKGA